MTTDQLVLLFHDEGTFSFFLSFHFLRFGFRLAHFLNSETNTKLFLVRFFPGHIHRYRLTSASDEDDFDDDVAPLFDDYEEHMQYMAARERLQEFPGRIPQRKKRNQSNANNQTRKAKVSTTFLFSF